MMLSEQHIAEGWLRHDGGPCPVAEESTVKVKLRSGDIGTMKGYELYWEHDGRTDDIIAYKPEPKP